MNESPHPPQPIAKAIAIAIVVAALTAAVYVTFVKGCSDLVGNLKDHVADGGKKSLELANQSYDLAKRFSTDIDNVIHVRPKVTTGGKTVVEASQSIAEISLVTKPFDHTFYWRSTWLGSTKRIKLKGSFIAKAGYDLTRPFSLDVSEDGQSIRAVVPPAKINSVEQTDVEVLQEENGIWNKISPAERQDAMNALLADARKALDETSLLADADRVLMDRLEGAVRKSAPNATIVREPSPLP